jgi:hypothetical protein
VRLLAATLLGTILLGVGAGSSLAAPQVSVLCSPGASDCAGWYRQPVTVAWAYSGATSTLGCDATTIDVDTQGTTLACTATDGIQHVTRDVTIKLDSTPPTVIGLVPARPADFGGWFNHPVGLGFRGSDATSGIASCTGTTYAGPDASPARITGGCTDAAGNAASATFPLAYDATPPPTPHVTLRPGNRRMTLRWSKLGAGELASVSRSRAGKKAASVFSGKAAGFTDRRLRNGRRYRYTVAIRDQAGNRARAGIVAVPTASRLLLPAKGARMRSAPLLVWKGVKRASYYNVQVFRGRHKAFSLWPRKQQLRLPHLRPGRYRWFLWGGFGRRAAHRYSGLLGSSSFSIR